MKEIFGKFKNQNQKLLNKVDDIKNDINNEKRGIYNVTFNNKNATPIKTDLEIIEDAIIAEVIMYVKGFYDRRRDKEMGAKHIQIHLDENSEGQITIEELLNLGNSIRAYLSIFKEPFIDNRDAKIYEWQNDNGVRFRAIVDKFKRKNNPSHQELGGPQLPLPPTHDAIITFYSDRNFKQYKGYDRMKFQNPQVENYYINQTTQQRKKQ